MTQKQRTTKETDIKLSLDVYGSGKYNIDTKIGFFDHMLESFTKHSLMDLNLTCNGDIHVDFHHSVEDVGIVLGEALKQEIFPIQNVERFSDCIVVMDEAAVQCALDLSNRPFLVYEVETENKIGEFDAELAEEFFRAVCFNAGLTVHFKLLRGKNRHHIIEAVFKSFAIALRRALAKNERVTMPSTKGVL